MAAYRIRTMGSRFVVGTEDEAVLICASLDIAQRAVADAECSATVPTWQLLSQRAARIADAAAAALAEGDAAVDADSEPAGEPLID